MGDPRAPEAAEKVRQAWIGLVRKGIGGEEAEEFDQRWAVAFEKARAKPAMAAPRPKPKTYAEIKAGSMSAKAKPACEPLTNGGSELAAEEAEAKA